MERRIDLKSERGKRYEDYLKAIYKISIITDKKSVLNSEIASYLNIKSSSVTAMLYILKEKDLIKWQPRKAIFLTKIGTKKAQELSNNYDKLRLIFEKIVKINNLKKIDEICCKLEHFFDSKASLALNQFVLEYENR
jgi:Mn-dependent DtxR family transcriptional regulator